MPVESMTFSFGAVFVTQPMPVSPESDGNANSIMVPKRAARKWCRRLGAKNWRVIGSSSLQAAVPSTRFRHSTSYPAPAGQAGHPFRRGVAGTSGAPNFYACPLLSTPSSPSARAFTGTLIDGQARHVRRLAFRFRNPSRCQARLHLHRRRRQRRANVDDTVPRTSTANQSIRRPARLGRRLIAIVAFARY